jgi:hypothetical protein
MYSVSSHRGQVKVDTRRREPDITRGAFAGLADNLLDRSDSYSILTIYHALYFHSDSVICLQD